MRITTCLFALAIFLSSAANAASVGSGFTYQGQLTSNGSPVTGPYDFQFALYNLANGGSAVDTLTQSGLTVSEGLINASLDFTDVPYNGQALWVEVRVRPGGSSGAYTTLAPRQALTPTPYALFALSGNPGQQGPPGSMGAIGPAGPQGPPGVVTLPFTGSGSDPSAAFSATNTGSGNGIVGQTTSAASGVYGGSANGAGYGVAGRAGAGSGIGAPTHTGVLGDSDSGRGVLGLSSSSNGVQGASSTGSGVYGTTAGTSGQSGAAGVWGDSHNFYGVWGTTVAGDGVHGNSTSGAGAWGESSGSDGVHGHTSSAAGTKSGVAGFGDGNNNGVFGLSTNGDGVRGIGINGNGIEGDSSGSASGVYGQNSSAGGYGVFGRNTAGGYGIGTDGPAFQTRSQGGWVKAMAHVVPVGAGGTAGHTITRCFNSQLPASAATTPPCGFTEGEPASGHVDIGFGFEVDDRFVVATGGDRYHTLAVCGNLDVPSIDCNNPASTSVISIYTYNTLSSNFLDEQFTIIVY